jgi:hypothetical protein
MTNDAFLDAPVADLPVSVEFYEGCKRMGFETVREALRPGINGLIQHPDFSYNWMSELLQLLSSRQLSHVLR